MFRFSMVGIIKRVVFLKRVLGRAPTDMVAFLGWKDQGII